MDNIDSMEWYGVKRFSMNPTPEELHDYMNRHYPGGIYYVFMKRIFVIMDSSSFT